MKILISENQLRILLEARDVTDLRGQLGDNFYVNPSGNFYVLMSKNGNLLIIDEIDKIGFGRSFQEFEKNEKTEEGTIESIMRNLPAEMLDRIPNEFKISDGKDKTVIKVTPNYNIGAILYVNRKKRTIQNVTTFEYIKRDQKDFKYKTNVYYDPIMVKKTIKDLISNNIIDNKFNYIDVNQEDDTINRTDYGEEEQYLYHGTTKTNADRILRIGLRPQDTEDRKDRTSLFRGNSSTLVGYTEKNVYLTPSLDVAKQYAFRQAEFNDDEPVVLKIQIPDKSKLVLDDDVIVKNIGRVIIDELNDRIEYVGKDEDKRDVKMLYKTDWTGDEKVPNLPTYINLLWRSNFQSLITKGKYETLTNLLKDPYIFMEPKDIEPILSVLPTSFFDWLKDIVVREYNKIRNEYYKKSTFGSEENSVAYRGGIPPKFISTVPVSYKLKRDI